MPTRITSPLLVGRDETLAALETAIAGALAGAPAFVIVRGEAGIGKSRLVAEALARRPAGATALVGGCLDIGLGGLPYLPLVEILRGLARTLPPGTLDRVMGPARDDLAALVPDLAGSITDGPAGAPGAPGSADAPASAAAPAELTSGLAQARLFERVLGMLRALTGETPVVLVVEDVHWIDQATRDLLTYLGHNLTNERMALVLTFREGDLPLGHPILGWIAGLARSLPTTDVEPARLERAAVDMQLRALAGITLPDPVRERIWRRSQGNPLYVEELYAAGPDEAEAPRSTADVLLVRFARLEATTRSVVEAAAVAGRPFDDRLVAAVLELPEADVEVALAAAITSGVLEVEASTDRYRFRHELLREVVERQLPPGARRRLHERFARSLEARPDLADPSPAGAAAELAVHFAEAGLPRDAYLRSIDASDAAETVHAYADALRHLERALALEARLPAGTVDERMRVDLRSRAADDADLAGAFERALELTRAALALVDVGRDPATAGLLHSRIGYLQWSLGEGTAALASHEAAVRLVPAEPPTRERARVLGALGGALMGDGRWAESRAMCEAAIECAVAAGATAEESRARNMLGSDLVALGHLDAGLEELREARRIAALARRPDMVIVAHHNLAVNLIAADRLGEALAEGRAALEVARDAGLERRFGQDLAALIGDALVRAGRLAEADMATADGIALDPQGTGTVYLAAVRARLAALRGDGGAAQRWRGGIDLADLDADVAAFVAAVAAESLLLEDRPDEALAMVDGGLDRLEGLDDVLWTAPLVALGLRSIAEQAAAAQVRPGAVGRAGMPSAERAWPRVDRLRIQLDRLSPRVSTPGGRGSLALARGELGRIEGRREAGDWLVAMEAFDAIPAPLTAAYARLRAAEAALQARGLRADVAALLGDAGTAATTAGAAPLAAQISALAARARIAPVASPSHADADPVIGIRAAAAGAPDGTGDPRAAALALGLSAREVEVLTLVTAGYTNGEIADALFISRKTAAVHVTHILDKLGVTNRVGAAMIGARVGLDRLAPAYGAVSE